MWSSPSQVHWVMRFSPVSKVQWKTIYECPGFPGFRVRMIAVEFEAWRRLRCQVPHMPEKDR
jgi:hypothetical protein